MLRRLCRPVSYKRNHSTPHPVPAPTILCFAPLWIVTAGRYHPERAHNKASCYQLEASMVVRRSNVHMQPPDRTAIPRAQPQLPMETLQHYLTGRDIAIYAGTVVLPVSSSSLHLLHSLSSRPPVDCDSSCLLYTSPSPRDRQKSRMPSSA